MKKTIFMHIVVVSVFVLNGCGGGGSGGSTVTSTTTSSSATSASVTVNEDNATVIKLQGSGTVYTLSSLPTHGTLVGTPPNLIYVPDGDYSGTDSFTFSVDGSAAGTISIQVDDANGTVAPVAPVAIPYSVTLVEDTNASTPFVGTDANDGTRLTFSVVLNPSHGTLSGTAPNLTYTPALNYNGADSFTYKANDGTVDSATVTVNLTVTAVNDAPIADEQNVTTNEDTAIAITLTGSDVDTGDTLTFSVVSNPNHGTLSGTAPNLIYTPNANYNGVDSFTYKANDGTIDSPERTIYINIQNSIHITDDVQIESLGKATSINKTIKIDTATAKNLYILFTNDNPSSSETVQITYNAKISPVLKIASTQKTIASKKSYILPTPNHIQNFTQNMQSTLIENNISISRQFKSLSIEPSYDIAGLTTQRFYLDTSSSGPFTDATARKVVSNVNTEFGNKTLNIWVSNDSFDDGEGCSKAKCVTQEMVDALADIFLKAGADNDIYDWNTNIFGEEWGAAASSKYSSLIGENNEITILLTDIENDNSTNGGTLGYFYAKDNFSKETYSGSNERIMFYIDAILFANSENTTWSIDDYWPKEMISTLAHEFQHMIHFYEKNVLLGVSETDTWMNEMLSETTEEVIATKIRHTGPRGVAYTDGSAGISGNTDGRYPLFNSTNTLSLTSWGNNLQDYSKVNAFGAFLTRNYGGVKVLHDIMYNTFSDEQAVMDAVHKTVQGEGKLFGDLIREWGVAVLLSTQDNLIDMPTYNTGDFTPNTYGNSTYDLGSINFFNYDPIPTIYTTAGTVQPQANYYYKIGDNISADVDINITLPASVEATLIAR